MSTPKEPPGGGNGAQAIGIIGAVLLVVGGHIRQEQGFG
jgi:hypothetical protein